jgi:hypothetical protein
MNENKKRKQIRAYFFPFDKPDDKPEKPTSDSGAAALIVVGIILGLIGCGVSSSSEQICAGIVLAFVGMGVAIGGFSADAKQKSKNTKYEKSLEEYRKSLKKYNERLENWGITESDLEKKPTGQQIDVWLQEDLVSIEEDALTYKLDLVRDQLKRDPLVIYGPLYWETYGIPDEELVYVKESPTNVLRFSCYRVVVVFLTESRVATYSCNFNFLRNARVGEKTVEYLYQDIVSVSTEEMSTNYSLPAGKTLQRAKVFRLAVASGDTIEVVVNSPQLKDILEGTLNLEDQDKNVQVIREMLRTKKG